MDELAQLEDAARAALPRLSPLAQGPLRAAIEQIVRARQLAGGNVGATDLGALPSGELAALVRRRRQTAALSQFDLAKRSGLSIRTIKNLERARHPPTQETLRRLLAVADLGLIAADLLRAPRGEEGPNCWLLPHYDRRELFDEMTELLNSAGGALEQTLLYLDDQSAADYLRLVQTPRIQSYFAAIPHAAVGAELREVGALSGLDVVALGPGDGRNEVRLCEALQEAQPLLDLRLYLLDISHPLLCIAHQHAGQALPGIRVETLHGDFHDLTHYPVLLPRPETGHRRRLYALLGCTLSNLDNEAAFWRDQMRLAAAGDWALIDFQLAASSPECDPALASPIHDQHARWFTGPLTRYARELAEHQVGVELSTACPVPGSYELGFYAQVRRRDGKQQRYLLYRVRRYEPEQLVRCLEGFGWRKRMLTLYGPGDASGLLLLERQKGG